MQILPFKEIRIKLKIVENSKTIFGIIILQHGGEI